MDYLKNEEEKEAIYFMEKASLLAKKALCLKAKCGSVIVKDGKVIGEGYNAPPQDREENRVCLKEFPLGKPKYDKTCCVHAEWRAILDALKRNPDKIIGSSLYFVRVDDLGNIKKSGKPYCTVCSRLALDSQISYFYLWHDLGITKYKTDEYNKLSYEYEHKI